ncbi:MAG: RluA family pseudouridine synthase [Planctomycetaceae bacterium]|nr:RluA family pseudouridine synthase [Planctomycetaceae bacterium]
MSRKRQSEFFQKSGGRTGSYYEDRRRERRAKAAENQKTAENQTEDAASADQADVEELDEDTPLQIDWESMAETEATTAAEPEPDRGRTIERLARPELQTSAADSQWFRFEILPAHQGVRIDIFLAEQFPELSRVKLRRTIAAGHARIDDEVVKPAFRLEPGQVLQLEIPPHLFDEEQKGEAIELDILWEDDQILAINKPAGMVVHPAKGHWKGTLTSGLIHRFRELSSIGGATRPGIVHRLDRETSGVILVAKTDQAHMNLVEQFQNRTVTKQYWSIVSPAPNFDQDHINLPIGKHPYQRERMAIRENHATSRPAETVFQVLERFRGFAIVQVMPKTGRTHQIRVHMAHIGCPVLCDRLYSGRASITEAMLHGGVDQAAGNDQKALLNRQALHAHKISFLHPISQAPLSIEAPLPADLLRIRDSLRQIRRL